MSPPEAVAAADGGCAEFRDRGARTPFCGAAAVRGPFAEEVAGAIARAAAAGGEPAGSTVAALDNG